jgi:hypothetical protein
MIRFRMPVRAVTASSLVAVLLLSACAVGPNYVRPTVSTPAAFKEAPSAQNGWVPSQPMDTIDRGAWWSVFNDPVLDGLERKVEVNNQNVAQALAAYDQSRALTSADAATLFPTATLTGSGQRSGNGGGSSGGSTYVDSNGNVVSSGGKGVVGPRRLGSYPSTGAERPGQHKPALPTSPTPSCRHRPNWPPTISTCASWTNRSGSMMRPWRLTRSR